MNYRPDTLVLSSGSDKGMAEIGALEKPFAEGMLSNLSTIVGCSVGAIIGYLLAIGYQPQEIGVFGLKLQMFQQGGNITQLGTTFGVCDHSTVVDKLTRLTLDKVRRLPTLADIYRDHGIRLIIPAVNINLDIPKITYFDYLNSPDLLALEAVKRSISIQPLFPPVSDGLGGLWVDGGVIDPFPISLLDDGHHTILGVHPEVKGGATDNFLVHMNLIISILVDEVKRTQVRRVSSRVKIITVRVGNGVMTDDPHHRLSMYYEGYFEGERFVERMTMVADDKPKSD